MYSTDNGAEAVSWPDGGITPFMVKRAPTGKAVTVFLLVKWPGVLKPGSKYNDMISHAGLDAYFHGGGW